MVDISAKPETDRRAEAEAIVIFPEEAWAKLAKNGFTTKKGAIFDVAITAGTMALKKTSESNCRNYKNNQKSASSLSHSFKTMPCPHPNWKKMTSAYMRLRPFGRKNQSLSPKLYSSTKTKRILWHNLRQHSST